MFLRVFLKVSISLAWFLSGLSCRACQLPFSYAHSTIVPTRNSFLDMLIWPTGTFLPISGS